jgi:NAD(P)H dehydrogenase (quinone)
MNIDAQNVRRNSLLFSALETTMQGRRSAQNVVEKNYNNLFQLSRQKLRERVSEVRNKFQKPRRLKVASKKVLILYYSKSGNTKKMAKAIAEAMKSDAINVTVKDVRKFNVSSLPDYDGIVLGSPTYFSSMAWQVKKAIDESIVHHSGRKLKGKVAGIFTSAGTSRDGNDCLKMLEVALGFHHEMKVIQGIVAHGESDREVEKRCQEYGKRLVKEIEK